jgi:hypothetical protein
MPVAALSAQSYVPGAILALPNVGANQLSTIGKTTITDTEEFNVMNESSKTPLVIGLVVVVLLFLFFGGGAMTGSMMGGGMMGQSGIGGYRMGHGWINGGFSWMWIPTLLTLGIGLLLGWMIFAKKRPGRRAL